MERRREVVWGMLTRWKWELWKEEIKVEMSKERAGGCGGQA